MSILFALSLFSFAALLWASLSIARHIRAGDSAPSEPFAGDRRLRRPPQADLNDTPLPHRLQQSPQRTSTATKNQRAA